jgi:hypothetical protein
MPKYIVRNIYKSVEEVEVEAENEHEALAAAMNMDGSVVDYFLYDSSAKEVSQ